MKTDLLRSTSLHIKTCAPVLKVVLYFLIFIAMAATVFGYWTNSSHPVKYIASSLVVIMIAEVILKRLFKDPGRVAHSLIQIGICMLAVSFCLIQVQLTWKGICGSYFIMGGLIPFSDAANYYHGAKSLIESGIIDPVSSRRPLGPCFISLLLFLTKGNLQSSILFNATLVGLSIYAASSLVAFRYGVTAGVLMVLGLFSSVAEFIPSTMTETVGLIFGCFALALLLPGIIYRRPVYTLIGCIMFGMALSIRAGAFFSIGFLAIYLGFRFAKKSRFNIRFCLVSLIALLLFLPVNLLVLKAISPSRAENFNASFAYVLYGLARGGLGWDYVIKEHPNIIAVSEQQRAKVIYALSVKSIKNEPGLFVKGISKSIQSVASRPLFLIQCLRPLLDKLSFFIVILFTAIGMVLMWYKRDPLLKIISYIIAGVILSSPLLLDGGLRVFTATSPFVNLIIAVGIGHVVMSFKRHSDDSNLKYPRWANLGISGGAALLLLAIIAGPVLLGLLSHSSNKLAHNTHNSCTEANYKAVRLSKGSFIHFVKDKSQAVKLFDVPIDQYRKSVLMQSSGFGNVSIGQYMGGVTCIDSLSDECTYLTLDIDPTLYDGKVVNMHFEKIVSDIGHNLYHGRICGISEK